MHGFEGPYDVYVGLDVGKRAHHACAVLADGSVAFRTGVDNSQAAIDRVIADAAELGTPLVVVDQRRNIGMLAIRRAPAPPARTKKGGRPRREPGTPPGPRANRPGHGNAPSWSAASCSPTDYSAVPSALGGLTSGFGMGPGVPPLPWPLTN